MWRLDGRRGTAADGPSTWRAPEGDGGSVYLAGADAAVADAVAPVVAGAGLRLRSGEAQDAPPGGGPVLWAAEARGTPPEHAVLVDVDERRLWGRAARLPEHRAVVLPAGRAWLAEHLAASAAGRPGRILAVTGLGDGSCSGSVAVAVAGAAQAAGATAVVVDPRGAGVLTLRAEAQGRSGQRPAAGWTEAEAWAGDGAVAGLLGALPRLGGVPVLAGHGAVEGGVAQGVIEALARGVDVLVVHAGEVAWPPQAADLFGADELVVCAGGCSALPSLPPVRREVPASLVTVRSGWRPPDGPRTAAALGCNWAGTFDARAGARPARARAALGRRVWGPRLLAGTLLGQA